MTLARSLLPSCVLVVGLNAACTFYTSCPDYRPNSGSPAGGGTGGGSGVDIGAGGEAPQGTWENETFNLAQLKSECGNVSYLSVVPGKDRLVVSIAQRGLLAKAAGGSEWLPLGGGNGSASITNRGSAIVYDPSDPDVFWEAGSYDGGGVYRTDDGGETFVDLGLSHNDYVSVDFSDPKRKTLLASGHDAPRTLHYSRDGGTTWQDIGASLPEEAQSCSWPVVLDASTFLLGCSSDGGGVGGVFRSSDAGDSWQRVTQHRVSRGPLLAASGSQYWGGQVNEGLVRTDDRGLTFEGPFGQGELAEATPIELPDGRIAALGQRRIVVSADKGKTWRVVTSELPFRANGVVYSAQSRAFYAYHSTCEADVPKDAIASYAFDYETK